MRILKVDLRAFSQFSNKSIEFDPSKNIHVLFGSNEAGKTSFCRAIEALFFGINKKTTDTFIHPADNLFIEGLLESQSGKFLQITRQFDHKKKIDKPWANFFPQLDKEALSSLFFLNQSSILMGSKDLIENIEHFDLSLFSSIRGSEQVLKILKDIEKEIGELYKPKGVKPLINQKLKALADLVDQKKNSELSLDDWRSIESKIRTAIEQKDHLFKEEEKAAKLRSSLKTSIEIYDHAKKLQELESLISGYDIKSCISRSALVEFEKIQALEKEHVKKVENLKSEIKKSNEQINSLFYNANFIEKRDLLNELIESSAENIKRSTRLEEIKDQLDNHKSIFKEQNLVLQKSIQSSFSEKNWDKVKLNMLDVLDSIKLSTNILEKSRSIYSKYQNELESLKSLSKKTTHYDLDYPRKLLWQAESIENAQNQLTQIEAKLQIENQTSLTLDELQSITLPSNETLKSFHIKYLEAMAGYSASLSKIQEIEESLNMEKVSFGQQSNKFDLEEYYKNKSKRQELANNLTAQWTKENYLEKFNDYLDLKSLLDEEDRAESYFFANINLISQQEKLVYLNEQLKKQQNFLSKYVSIIEKQSEEFKKELGFGKIFPEINFFSKAHVEHSFEFLDQLSLFKSNIEQFKLIKQLENDIKSYLGVKKLSFEELVPALTSDINQKTKLNKENENFQKKIFSLETAIEKQSQQIDEDCASVKKSKMNWEKIRAQFQIDVSSNPLEIENLIKNMDLFFELSKSIQKLSDEFKTLMADVDSYEKSMINFFGFTSINPEFFEDVKSELKAQSLVYHEKEKLLFLKKTQEDHLTELNSDRKKIGELWADFESQFSLKASDLNLNDIERLKSFFQSTDKKDEAIAALKLKCGTEKLDSQLKKVKGYDSLKDLESEYKEASTKLQEVRSRIEDAQKDTGILLYQQKMCLDFTDKNKLDEAIQNESYDLLEAVQQLLVLKSSQRFLQNSIWKFQESQQEDLLKSASQIFSELTDGKYQKLKLNLLEMSSSFLECVDTNGVLLKVDDLSEGTRDQLFIALKFAFIDCFFKDKECFPIILDDILVNFDDQRVENCIKVLEKLSQNSQLIFLTHHKHILELLDKNLSSNQFEVLNLSSQTKLHSA